MDGACQDFKFLHVICIDAPVHTILIWDKMGEFSVD